MTLTTKQLNEWCDTLEKYPERQYTGHLVSECGTKFCCLGQLAMLNGGEIVNQYSKDVCIRVGGHYDDCTLYAVGRLFGMDSYTGVFEKMGMPRLSNYETLTQANDAGVPWPTIAAHLRKYYKPVD